MFILNVADQHFQHVLHCEETHYLAIAFLDQHEVRAALAELLQQVAQRQVLGDPLQRAQQFVETKVVRQVLIAGQRQQQVLDMQQTGVFALIPVVDRIAAVLVEANHVEDLRQRCVVIQLQQVFAGVGPVGDFQLAHLDRRGEHLDLRVGGVQRAVGVQDQLQLLAAVMVLVLCAGLALAGDAQDGVGAGVEQVDRRVHQPVEQVQRHRCPQ